MFGIPNLRPGCMAHYYYHYIFILQRGRMASTPSVLPFESIPLELRCKLGLFKARMSRYNVLTLLRTSACSVVDLIITFQLSLKRAFVISIKHKWTWSILLDSNSRWRKQRTICSGGYFRLALARFICAVRF